MPAQAMPAPAQSSQSVAIVAAAISLETHQAPVPLVRSIRSVPVMAASPVVSLPDAEAQTHDDFDERAAKAAIEADGYKRVSVLGKNNDGTWRAKAYRGTTDVRLTVDGTGRVSAE
jgi:hypothetical protein